MLSNIFLPLSLRRTGVQCGVEKRQQDIDLRSVIREHSLFRPQFQWMEEQGDI